MRETKKPFLDEQKKEILKKVLDTAEVTDEELDEVSGGSCSIACSPGCLLSEVKAPAALELQR